MRDGPGRGPPSSEEEEVTPRDSQPPKEKPIGLHYTIMKGLRMGVTKEKMAEVMGITVGQINTVLLLQSEN